MKFHREHNNREIARSRRRPRGRAPPQGHRQRSHRAAAAATAAAAARGPLPRNSSYFSLIAAICEAWSRDSGRSSLRGSAFWRTVFHMISIQQAPLFCSSIGHTTPPSPSRRGGTTPLRQRAHRSCTVLVMTPPMNTPVREGERRSRGPVPCGIDHIQCSSAQSSSCE